jgi:2,7-dihydroxy-5-methyl-1-naphthoate 7-O-methyltransferase
VNAIPDKALDLDALGDLRTPWCLRVVVTLGIADHVAAGRAEIDQLAAAADCDPDYLRLVMQHLVGVGVFDEPEPGRFALNAAARQLLEPGSRIVLDLDGIGGRMAHAWSTLLTAVRTGAPAYHELFGLPFWEDLDAHPDVAASFDVLMGPEGHGAPDPEVLVSGGWESVRTVVDVGGGTGTLLAEILRSHQEIRGTLVDFPRTVARAQAVFTAAGVGQRATAFGQSFFDALPAGADLYILSRVLNDWPDPDATAILRRCGGAVRPTGRVVVIGGVSADGHTGQGLSPELVLVGGVTRSLARFRELAGEAGLEVQAAGMLASGRFAVECGPA